jgi:hypothetical protein
MTPLQFPLSRTRNSWIIGSVLTIPETKTQDVAEVLDPTSTPTTVADKALFREKQTYIAEVLDPTCTPTILAFVRSKSLNVDSFGDERRALIRGSAPTVDAIDDCIMHRNVGLYDAHARKVKRKNPLQNERTRCGNAYRRFYQYHR